MGGDRRDPDCGYEIPNEKQAIAWAEDDEQADQGEIERLSRDLEEVVVRYGDGTLRDAGVCASYAGGHLVLDLVLVNHRLYRLTLMGPLGDDTEDALG